MDWQLLTWVTNLLKEKGVILSPIKTVALTREIEEVFAKYVS